MNYNTLLKLKAESPVFLLKRLNKHIKLEEGKENPVLPHVVIGLHGGSLLSGFLLNYNEETGDILLGHFVDAKPDLKFCNSTNIVSLELLDCKPYLYSLADGAIVFTPNEQDIPTGLALKRLIKEVNDNCNGLIGKEVVISFSNTDFKEPIDLYNAKMLIKALQEVIEKIVENELGKKAINEKVNQITIKFAEENKVELNESKLSIIYKIENGPALSWSVQQLQSEIEEKL